MNIISSLGLVSDIIGILILFKYGLPSKIREHGGTLLVGETDEQIRVNRNISPEF